MKNRVYMMYGTHLLHGRCERPRSSGSFAGGAYDKEVARRLRVVSGSYVGKFVQSRLDDELKRFHNPTSEKTRRLFRDFLEIDITAYWEWLDFDPVKASRTLDELIAKRGEAVHRSKPSSAGVSPTPHLVRRDDLDKAIRFLRGLVSATDCALVEREKFFYPFRGEVRTATQDKRQRGL